MSNAAALNFTYLYPFSSSVGELNKGFGLQLATCGAHHEHPHFFEGRLKKPRQIADMLLVLSNIVRTHFFLQRIPMLDPVVTSSEDMIRFEGFSGCCGVYVRVDLLPEAFETEVQNRGTTNVDFNNPMRAALTRLRDKDESWLSVGKDEVVLSKNEDSVIEKKVKLPVRWVKGFSEVQTYQQALDLQIEVSAAEARKFMRSLPKTGAPKRPSYISQFGKSLRVTQREQNNAIRLTGMNRLKIIEPLMPSAKGMRIWANTDSSISGWEVQFDIGKFFIMISPELYRGFSGEGQNLEKLAEVDREVALKKVQAQLSWQSNIDVNQLVSLTGQNKDAIKAALMVLGSRGLAGYDVTTGTFFHRILPFELDKVEQLQPRLKNARKLLDEKKIKLVEIIDNASVDYSVEGTTVCHTVRLREEQDKCTCPWFSKYQGQRGPCKHILAARLFDEKTRE